MPLSKPIPPSIPHPLHLLILSPTPSARSTLPPFLTALTSTTPPDSISIFTGYTTHAPLRLETRYYTADVGVWCDEIPVARENVTRKDTPAEGKENKDENPQGGIDEDITGQWARQFQAEEAKEVLTAIGAVILVLPSSRHARALKEAVSASVLAAAKELRQTTEEERAGGDVVGICCVVSTSSSSEEQGDEEDRIMESLGLGWEVVFWDGKADVEKEKGKKNAFGELQSIPRIHEILSANEWAANEPVDLDFDEDQDIIDDTGFSIEANELEREMFGLRSSILLRGEEWGGEDDGEEVEGEEGQGLKVDELAGLMERIRGIRDMGKDMPEDERKRYAARAVNEIMKTL